MRFLQLNRAPLEGPTIPTRVNFDLVVLYTGVANRGTYIEFVHTEADDVPFYVKETPERIDDILKYGQDPA